MVKIGMRNIKTAISVFICLMIYFLILVIAFAFNSDWVKSFKIATQIYTPFFACLATAYSVSVDKEKSLAQAKLRLSASIIGGLFGLFVIIIYQYVFRLEWPFQHISATGNPTMDLNGLFGTGFLGSDEFTSQDVNLSFVLSFIAPVVVSSLSVVAVIWICNAIKRPQCSFIAVLTLTAVMTSLGTNPIIYGPNRILSTIIGILVALMVNFFHLPRHKNKNTLFVIGMDGIYKKDNDEVNGYNAFKVNSLMNSGANVTYFTTRSPVVMLKMIGSAKPKNPVICLSGAAMYDLNTFEYSYVQNIDIECVVRLKAIFEEHGVSPFINIIDDNVLYTYNEHIGSEAEAVYAKNRKNSAYSCYVPGEAPRSKDVCYYVCVETKELNQRLKEEILKTPFANKLYLAEYDCYEKEGKEDYAGYSYLKIYSANVLKLDCIANLKTKFDKIVGVGTHEYDDYFLASCDLSITNVEACGKVKNASTNVLNNTSSEALLKEVGKEFHRKYPNSN